MSLPETRNTTYTAGLPVKSADLNDLQDAIVARQHGAIELWVPASAFHSTDASPTNFQYFQAGYLSNISGQFSAHYCSPALAAGTIVDAAHFLCYRETSITKAFNTRVALPFGSSNSINDSSTENYFTISHSVTLFPHTVNAQPAATGWNSSGNIPMQFEVSFPNTGTGGNGSLRFFGMYLDIRKP